MSKCPLCQNELTYEEIYPPIFDEETKAWKLDKKGYMVFKDDEDKVAVPKCVPCKAYFL